MTNLKIIVATAIVLIYGFIGFTLCAGLGMLIGTVFVVFPWWGVVLGTLFGSAGVLLYLIGGKKE